MELLLEQPMSHWWAERWVLRGVRYLKGLVPSGTDHEACGSFPYSSPRATKFPCRAMETSEHS